VERHIYPLTVVSVSWHCKNQTKRVGVVQSLIIISLKSSLFYTTLTHSFYAVMLLRMKGTFTIDIPPLV